MTSIDRVIAILADAVADRVIERLTGEKPETARQAVTEHRRNHAKLNGGSSPKAAQKRGRKKK